VPMTVYTYAMVDPWAASPYSSYGYDPYSYGGYDPYYYSPSYSSYDPFGYSSYYNDDPFSLLSYNYDPYSYNPYSYTSYSSYDPYSYDPYSYTSYGYDPYSYSSYGYDPYAYNGGYDPYGYSPEYYGGYRPSKIQRILPFLSLIQAFTGNSLFGGIIQQTMGYGYDQGYYAGMYAGDNGYSDRYIYDPYRYYDAGYDPYSISIGQKRAYLSQGYQAGYRDGYQAAVNDGAVYNSSYYDPYYNGGNVDLVSVMLGNVLSTVL
jgi:hypothetical protein